MNDEILIKIKNALGSDYRQNTDGLIKELYEEYTLIALDYSNLRVNKERLYPYVKNAVIAKYNCLGRDGMSSSSEGSESYSFIDIEEKLRTDIRKAGLRRLS